MEGKQQSIYEIRTKVESFVLEYLVIKEQLPPKQISLCSKWSPPARDMVKVNFDAAFRQNQYLSCSGFVIQNYMGLIMGSGLIINTNVANAFSAEAMACLQAMSFAKDMGFLM